MRRLGGSIAAVFLALPGIGRAAGPCDPNLIPARGPNQYEERPTGLCEGLYASRVGASPIELVSLTRGTLPASSAALDLSVAIPTGTQAVRLRGIGIPNGLYYRLDAAVSSGQVLHWRPGQVLGALGISLGDVGLFAFTEDATGTPVYLPVDIRGNIPPAGRVVEFRTANLVEDLRWRFLSGTGGDAGIPWHPVDVDSDRLSFELPSGAGVIEVRWSDEQTGQPQLVSFQVGG